jgi:hypothetical protein
VIDDAGVTVMLVVSGMHVRECARRSDRERAEYDPDERDETTVLRYLHLGPPSECDAGPSSELPSLRCACRG